GTGAAMVIRRANAALRRRAARSLATMRDDAGSGTFEDDPVAGVGPVDLLAVERELCRLPDVGVARLVADDAGRIIEAHIIAAPTKHPKQIVRDVQSVLLAEFGLELDRKVVSVVQLGDDDLPRPADERVAGRPSIVSIQGETNGLRSLVRVTL